MPEMVPVLRVCWSGLLVAAAACKGRRPRRCPPRRGCSPPSPLTGRRAVLLPAAMLRMPSLRRGTAGAFVNTAATSSAMTLATLYLQDTRDDSPLAAAVTLLPFSIAVVAGSAGATPAPRRIRPRYAMAAGLAVIAIADAALAAAAPHRWAVPACVAAAGAGLGLFSVASTALGTTVPARLRGTGSGIINTAASLAPPSASRPSSSSLLPPPACPDPARTPR